MWVHGTRWVFGLVTIAAVLAGCGTTGGPATGTPSSGANQPSRASTEPSGGASAKGAPVWFSSLQMISPRTGWALRWTRNPGRADAAVLAPARTTDGGRTWSDVTPSAARPLLTPTATTGTLFALGGERAWFAVSRQRAHRPVDTVVFATSDGGRTWRSSPAFASLGSPSMLDFTDADHGWLVADRGAAMGSDAVAVFSTSDGGLHWSPVSRTPSLAGQGRGSGALPLLCDKSGIIFSGTRTGWLTGACNAGAPFVEVTHNGGRTWAPQPVPGQDRACRSGSQADSPQFFGSTGYLAVSCFPRPWLLVTHDGGATWSRLPLPAQPGVFPRVDFVSARRGFLIPEGPQDIAPGGGPLPQVLYRTLDGGRDWQAVHPRMPAGVHGTLQVGFVSASTGFAWLPGTDAASGAPPLCSTRDGGRTWACSVPRVVTGQHSG